MHALCMYVIYVVAIRGGRGRSGSFVSFGTMVFWFFTEIKKNLEKVQKFLGVEMGCCYGRLNVPFLPHTHNFFARTCKIPSSDSSMLTDREESERGRDSLAQTDQEQRA